MKTIFRGGKKYRPGNKAFLIAVTLLLPLSFSLTTQAQGLNTAKAIYPTVLRAGPAHGFAGIAGIAAGQYLTIYGCLEDKLWCNASIGVNQGWIAASQVVVFYQGYPYLARDFYRVMGVPIVVYVRHDYGGGFNGYWHGHEWPNRSTIHDVDVYPPRRYPIYSEEKIDRTPKVPAVIPINP